MKEALTMPDAGEVTQDKALNVEGIAVAREALPFGTAATFAAENLNDLRSVTAN